MKKKTNSKPPSSQYSTPENKPEKVRLSMAVKCGARRTNDPKYIKAIAEDLLRNAQKEDMLTLEEYYVLLPEDLSTIDRWISKHACLRKANEKAKTIIGIRREKGVIRRDFEPSKTVYCMHHYLERWDKADKHHASIKAAADANANESLRDIMREDTEKILKDQRKNANTGTKP